MGFFFGSLSRTSSSNFGIGSSSCAWRRRRIRKSRWLPLQMHSGSESLLHPLQCTCQHLLHKHKAWNFANLCRAISGPWWVSLTPPESHHRSIFVTINEDGVVRMMTGVRVPDTAELLQKFAWEGLFCRDLILPRRVFSTSVYNERFCRNEEEGVVLLSYPSRRFEYLLICKTKLWNGDFIFVLLYFLNFPAHPPFCCI